MSVQYEVPLIPQPTDASCWAAAAAMVVAWRDQLSLPAEPIRDLLRSGLEEDDGLTDRGARKLAAALDLTIEPLQSYSAEGLYDLLCRFGPLWVTGAVPSIHAFVVTGMAGTGPAAQVVINDPWPPGQGAQSVRKFTELAAVYELAAVEHEKTWARLSPRQRQEDAMLEAEVLILHAREEIPDEGVDVRIESANVPMLPGETADQAMARVQADPGRYFDQGATKPPVSVRPHLKFPRGGG